MPHWSMVAAISDLRAVFTTQPHLGSTQYIPAMLRACTETLHSHMSLYVFLLLLNHGLVPKTDLFLAGTLQTQRGAESSSLLKGELSLQKENWDNSSRRRRKRKRSPRGVEGQCRWSRRNRSSATWNPCNADLETHSVGAARERRRQKQGQPVQWLCQEACRVLEFRGLCQLSRGNCEVAFVVGEIIMG